MKHDSSIQWRMAQLAARLSPSLVTALWIVRAASPDYAPAYEQLGFLDMPQPPRGAAAPPETPWHAVVQAAKAERLVSVANALRPIMPQSPLLQELEALPPLAASGEAALEELTELLSGLSPASLSRLYPLSASPSLSLEEEFDLPLCVLRLLLSVLDIRPGSRLYDPCCGSGALLARSVALLPREQRLSFTAQAMDPAAYQLCHVHAYLSGVSIQLGERYANPLLEDLHPEALFDCILAHPPFNQSGWYQAAQTPYDSRWQFGIPPRSNGNFAWLQHVYSHLSPEGHAALILPNGTLTTQTQSERSIRAGLLEKGAVEAVIALPAGIFASTKAPCCIWLLAGERASTASTLFIDAQGKNLTGDLSEDMLTIAGLILHHRCGLPLEKTRWYGQASRKEIQERDHLLSPNFYTLPPPREAPRQALPRLASLIDSLLPRLSGSPVCPLLEQWKQISPAKRWDCAPISRLCQITGGVVKKKEAFGQGMPMADVATVIRNPFLPDVLPALVEITPEEWEKYRVRAGDIFMNRSSESVEELACCCVADSDREAVYGGYLKRLRLLGEDPPDSRYLAAYFRSGIYRREIARVSPVFTTRSNINRRQLSQVMVYYPDRAMQETLGQTFHALWQFRSTCSDPALVEALDEFTALFIEQFISCPIALLSRELSDRQP